MRLKKKLKQSRRDFQGQYECEHCGHEVTDQGLRSYDDAYFHLYVIPSFPCPACGKKADPNTPKTAPDVPAHIVI